MNEHSQHVVYSLLTEGYSYSTTQINMPTDLAGFIATWGQANIPDDMLFVDEDDHKGREDEIHVTVKYGLLEPTPSPKLKEIVETTKPFVVTLTKISLFRQEDHDVVKIDVDSPGLRRLNARITAGRPHGDKWPSYRPHVTVAYVRKGSADHLEGQNIFRGEDAVSPSFVAYELTFRGKNESEATLLPFSRTKSAIKEGKQIDPFRDVPFGSDPSRIGKVLTRRRRHRYGTKKIVDSLLEGDDDEGELKKELLHGEDAKYVIHYNDGARRGLECYWNRESSEWVYDMQEATQFSADFVLSREPPFKVYGNLPADWSNLEWVRVPKAVAEADEDDAKSEILHAMPVYYEVAGSDPRTRQPVYVNFLGRLENDPVRLIFKEAQAARQEALARWPYLNFVVRRAADQSQMFWQGKRWPEDFSESEEDDVKSEILRTGLSNPLTYSVALNPPSHLYHRTKKNKSGSPVTVKVNGRTRTWKRRPGHFEIPVKYGLYGPYFYITSENADEWTTTYEFLIPPYVGEAAQKQPGDVDCGPSCLKMVASYLGGKNMTAQEIAQACGTSQETGTTAAMMQAGMNELGINATQPAAGGADYLKNALKNGSLMLLRSAANGLVHWILVYGYAGGEFYCNDPWLGKLRYSPQDLVSVWKPGVFEVPPKA